MTLPAVPGLGRMLRAGAGEAAGRLARPGRRSTAQGAVLTQPDVAYRVPGIRTGAPDDVRRLSAYQRLLGEPGSDVMPAGYLHVLGFPVAAALMTRRDFPLPVLGLVHLANTASLLRPVRLGDVLEVRAWAQNIGRHRRGTQGELVTEVAVNLDPSSMDDEAATALAFRSVSTYLAKGFGVSRGDVRQPSPTRSPDAPFTPPLPTARWTLDAGVGRAYAAVSGDRNPLHTSALGARVLGFPRAIAHGMYTAARALAEVGAARGDAYDWTVRFEEPVLLPGTVDVAIRPLSEAAGSGGGRGDAGYGYVAWNGEGRRHFTGGVVPRG